MEQIYFYALACFTLMGFYLCCVGFHQMQTKMDKIIEILSQPCEADDEQD